MDQDQLELSTAIQPQLRAVDAYNAREELVAYLRSFGVTTVHTGHGPGALASGQTMIVKTRGDTVDEAVVEPLTMIAFTLGPGVSSRYKSPGTRAKGVAMLRADLIKAQRYVEKQGGDDPAKRPDPDLELDALAKVLRREVPALVTAQTATEIMTALRLQKEFGFDLVLDGAAEAYLVLDEIRAAGVPVLLHPTMVRPGGELENAAFDTAAKLRDAKIPFAFQSGYESYVPKTRVVLFEAAIAAANGLTFDQALAAITIDAARIVGVDQRVGSLEQGKDADLALFDGDPFEYTSRVCGVVIEGEVVSEHAAEAADRIATSCILGVLACRAAAAQPRLVGTEFQINVLTQWQQTDPAVARDDDGDFVVTWSSQPQPGASQNILFSSASTRTDPAVAASSN